MEITLQNKLISSDEKDNSISEEKVQKLVDKYGFKDSDPFSSANFISRFFLYWAYKVIKLGNLLPLKSEYFGKLKGKFSTIEYLKSIKNIWEAKGYKFKQTLPLVQAGFRANLNYAIIVFTLSLIKTLINLLSIDIFREYMKRFKANEDISNDNSYYSMFSHKQIGIACLGIKLFEIFFDKRCNEYQVFMAFKNSSEFQCLLFDKLLKVSPSSMKERAETGQVTNFMQIDAHRLTFLMMSSPDLITIPMNLIGYSYMLFKFFGISFIFGIGTLIMFLLINVFFTRKFKKLHKKQMALKDKRMKKITETFNNIKILKLYSWENEFRDKIDSAREDELQNLSERFSIQNINETIQWFAPVAISVASIGAYQYFNSVLKIEDIMTSLRIFTSLQMPIRMIPFLINNFYEVAISMKRIQKYLFQDEINPANIIKKDKYMDINNLSIKIENGYYSWGVPPTSLAEIKMQDLKSRGISLDMKNKKNFGGPKIKKKDAIELSTDINKGPDYIKFNDENLNENNIDNKSVISTSSSSLSSNSKKDKLLEKINAIDLEGGLGLDNSFSSVSIKPSLPQKTEKKKINPLEPILKNINFEIKQGEFICIIGEVGCGKSSLLQAILNCMISLQRGSKIYVNGTISYVSQIPWIQNATIKDNILFYQPYEEDKYNKVIELSELRPDLEIFEAGDLTEIGEKGVNLSGGQKARVSIARALYADKDIYIFDDPISALDANVGMKVMQNCIIKHLKGKTRILVTHALPYISFSDRIMYMNKGEIKWIGTYDEIKEQEFFKVFYEKMEKEKNEEKGDKKKKISKKEFIKTNVTKEEENNLDNKEDVDINMDKKELNKGKIKKLTKEEIKERGKVKLSVYKDFLMKIGGVYTISLMLILMIIMELSHSAQDLWLGYWTEHQDPSKNNIFFGIFCLFGIIGCAFTYCKLRTQSKSNIQASRSIHQEMVKSLIRAPVPTFHETVPKGQILNRFSSDINSLDRGGLNHFLNILSTLILFISCIGICGYYEPYSLLTIPVIIFIGHRISIFFRNSSRELQRIESGTRSPVLNLCNEVIPGTTTIRAFNFEKKYMLLFHDKVDEHLKFRIITNGCNQWYNMSLDLISFSFVAFLITFTMLFKDKFSAAAVAIIYTYCDKMKMSLIRGLRTLTFYENSMIGYERCVEYTKCPCEAAEKLPKDDELINNWPSKGKIEFIDFSVKYRPNTEIVLKKINFVVQGKEKVGIVGRTGSGKSTITLCLFRILEATEGKILIDDVDISTIGLELLRKNLTIIPQDPSLMEGSLRYNIDPLEKSDDNEIIKIMQKIGFDYIIKRSKDGLNQEIAEGGTNLSVGEKQLICITRAILRKSKIIIMDEATASIDYKTEEIIQKAINELLNESTFITIAHRIKTILNYDKILTLDNGIVVDFDTPKNLLNDKKSLFYELYSKSNL